MKRLLVNDNMSSNDKIGFYQEILCIDDIPGWIATRDKKQDREKITRGNKKRIFVTDPYWVMPHAIKTKDKELYDKKRHEILSTISKDTLKWWDSMWVAKYSDTPLRIDRTWCNIL